MFVSLPTLLPKQNPNLEKDPMTSLNASMQFLVRQNLPGSLVMEQKGSGRPAPPSQSILQKVTLPLEWGAGFF